MAEVLFPLKAGVGFTVTFLCPLQAVTVTPFLSVPPYTEILNGFFREVYRFPDILYTKRAKLLGSGYPKSIDYMVFTEMSLNVSLHCLYPWVVCVHMGSLLSPFGLGLCPHPLG